MPLPLYAEFYKTLTDTLRLAATPTKLPGKSNKDTLRLGDAKLFSIIHLIAESLKVGDGQTDIFSRIITETLRLSSTVTKSESRSVSEIIRLNDATIKKDINHKLTDGLRNSDAILKSLTRAIADNLRINDAYSKVWTLNRIYSDGIKLSDITTKSENRALSENVRLSDVKLFVITKLLKDSLRLAYTLDKLKTLPMYAELYKTCKDTIRVTDNYSRTWNVGNRTYHDYIKLIDIIHFGRYLTVEDILTISDGDIKDVITRLLTETFLINGEARVSIPRNLMLFAQNVMSEMLSSENALPDMLEAEEL